MNSNDIVQPDAFKYNVIDEKICDYINVKTMVHDDSTCYYITIHTVDGNNTYLDDKIYFNLDYNSIDSVHSYLTQKMKMTNSHKVKQFTEESTGVSCPKVPQKMNKDEIIFLMKMMLSEMTELAQTVCDNPQEAIDLVKNCVGVDVNMNYKKPTNDIEIIAQQVDAGVDCWYYFLNAMAKKGINADRVFNIVQKANMAKKWDDGKFHRREDGKVIKPDSWTPPNIEEEIEFQMKNETL